MFKKIIAVLIAVFLVLGLCACGLDDVIPSEDKDITTSDIDIQDGDKTRVFTMKDYNASFTVPDDFQVDMEETQLDMFFTNGDVHIGVYGFLTSDFADDADYEDVWEEQCEADLERFKNTRELDHDPEFKSTDKEIETVLYSAEYENLKQYIYYIYVKPEVDADAFLWITVGGLPSDMRDNFDVIEGIIDSIKFSKVNM